MDKFFYPGKGAVLFMLCEIYIESLGCYVFYLRGVVWLFKEKSVGEDQIYSTRVLV